MNSGLKFAVMFAVLKFVIDIIIEKSISSQIDNISYLKMALLILQHQNFTLL